MALNSFDTYRHQKLRDAISCSKACSSTVHEHLLFMTVDHAAAQPQRSSPRRSRPLNNRLRLSMAGYRPVAEKYENSITSCLISFGITSLLVWGVPCGHPSGALIHIFTTMRASSRAS